MRRIRVPVLIAYGVVATALVGCGRGQGESESSLPPTVVVRARAVEERTFNDVVTAEGQWRSSGEIVIAAPFAGVVDSVEVRLGDRVRAGQGLCRLITRESQAALRGATLLARDVRDEAARVEAKRALELARKELIGVPVVAPHAGIVVRLSVRAGSEIGESSEILAILSPEAIVFEAHVSARDATRVREGQRASIAEEGRTPRRAVVQRALPAAGAGDQSTLVWLSADQTGPTPEVDRFGSATIFVGPARTASAVPDSALVQDDLTGVTRVAVIDAQERAIWTPVTLGAGAEGWRELVSPALATGSRVITQGQRGLPDSTHVRPAP